MFFSKINSDVFLLVLLVVRLRLDFDNNLNDRYLHEPESREVYLGSTSAYTQITFHSPYSNILYPHPKSLEFNEHDEASILFSRLNYFNSFRGRTSNLLAYHANSSDVQNAASIESSNAEIARTGNTAGDTPFPTLTSSSQSVDELSLELQSTTPAGSHDLSAEDMKLIEVLWKQDIDLGISRDSYDLHNHFEVEKVKEAEGSKDTEQKFHNQENVKHHGVDNADIEASAAQNYLVDLETGEFVLDQLCAVGEENSASLQNETFVDINDDSFMPFSDNDLLSDLPSPFTAEEFPELLVENYTDSDYLLSQIGDIDKELESLAEIQDTVQNELFPESIGEASRTGDLWSESNLMLSEIATGNSDPNSFDSLLSNIEAYENNNPNLPDSFDDNLALFFDDFLEAPVTEETFQIPLSAEPSNAVIKVEPHSFHNGSDPLPMGSFIDTMFKPDQIDISLFNESFSEYQIKLSDNDMHSNDDLELMTVPSEVQLKILNDEHCDANSVSASTSGQASVNSDCLDYGGSCSDLSSNENTTYSHVTNLSSLNSPSHVDNIEFHDSIPYKQIKIEKEELSENNEQCISVRSKCLTTFGNHARFSERETSSPRKFDYSKSGQSGTPYNSVLHHDHSYPIPFPCDDTDYKPFRRDKYTSRSEDESRNKDEKRAKELKLPISVDDIINLDINECNERLSKYKLTDEQHNLIRDIRRRGKNKVAAQNCRKRKMDQINTLQQDLDELQYKRERLISKRDVLHQKRQLLHEKYAELYQIVAQYTDVDFLDPPNSCLNYNDTLISTSNSDTYLSDEDSDL